ncbi:arginine deiminase family protein [Streptomyces natalensis]|uniref:Glycine amidinotransferase n=1 Tax=Streptomyces natalensis ATCC 27448 TaxID=1240678 RepID=A0A0D7CTF2_9ACTN|nr:arginine deiminase family protein [Streptomyces natalensis]KIZ19539.1 glycine amidinotransferase [Streptomyces natalensis ATCC 27448]
MTATAGIPLVNAWNEWDTLREVVVGSADGACFEPTEPGNRPQVRRHKGAQFPTGRKSAEAVARANEELNGLARLLESRAVTVRRPGPHDFSRPLRTPHFDVENQYCAVCPRDVLITLGNEIVEATMSRRARYFEYEPYRHLVYEYWEADPRVGWTVAPKPTMSDAMYRQDFWEWPIEERHRRMHASEFCVGQTEVVFDAADMSRFGRDILVQESMTTNRAGIRWLKRTLEPKGFRVHPVHFPLDYFPSHIDCTFVPLRPGLILANPDRPISQDELSMFTDNGWELIQAPEPVLTNDEMPPYCQSSKWLSMNVLSLSPSTVICEEQEKSLQDLLADQGFEVLTVPFRNVFEYGGSLHCATWDIRRDGTREDYFPSITYEPLV